MATTVISRPEKILADGFVSRWNSITLPLIYQFTNDKFPINSFDEVKEISSIAYSGADGGTLITFTGSDDLIPLDKVSFQETGITGLDGTVQSIIPSTVGSGQVVIDFFTDETSFTGLMQKFYNNYKVLVNVYKGAPFGHPYEEDQTKPLEKLGTLEIDFTTKIVDVDTFNFGVVDIHTLAGLGTNSDFDYEDENSRNSWNAFVIEFAESHDQSNGNEILTFVDEFDFDITENCTGQIGFVDPSFENGLDDWLQFERFPNDIAWITGVGSISVELPGGVSILSDVIYQNISLLQGVNYSVSADIDLQSGLGSLDYDVQIFGFNGTDWIFLGSKSFSGLGPQEFEIGIVPGENLSRLGLVVSSDIPTVDSLFILEFFDVSNQTLQAVDPNFDNGMNDWLQGGRNGSTSEWVGAVGSVSNDLTVGQNTNILFQDVDTIFARTAVTIEIDFDLISADLTNDVILRIEGWGASWFGADINTTFNITSLGVGTYNTNVYWERDDITRVAVLFGNLVGTPEFEIKLNKFNFFFQVTEWKNSDFDNGLDDWLQTCNRLGDLCVSWVAGVGQITLTANESMTLYQEMIIFSGAQVHIEIDFQTVSGLDSNLTIWGKNINTGNWDSLHVEIQLSVGFHNIVIDLEIPNDIEAIGFDLIQTNITDNEWIVTRAELSSDQDQTQGCQHVLFGAFGTNQFQNALGGNFGDFVAHNENALFMTVFDEYRYFFESPFYASIIITDALFSASIDQNSVFLEIDFLDNTGASLGVLLHLVETKQEGVYHIAPDIAAFLDLEGIGKNDWKTAKMILIQQTGEPEINQITEEKIINNSLACAPSFSPVPLRFLNASGGWDTWTWQQLKVLDEVRSKNVTVKKDILSDFDNVFINGDTQYQTSKLDSRKTLLLRSLTLTEEELVGLSQLCNSVRVQIFINDRWMTVSVDTNSMNVFNEEAKIRTLTMSVRLNDTLNQTS